VHNAPAARFPLLAARWGNRFTFIVDAGMARVLIGGAPGRPGTARSGAPKGAS
jgi:hypothetical protein